MFAESLIDRPERKGIRPRHAFCVRSNRDDGLCTTDVVIVELFISNVSNVVDGTQWSVCVARRFYESLVNALSCANRCPTIVSASDFFFFFMFLRIYLNGL